MGRLEAHRWPVELRARLRVGGDGAIINGTMILRSMPCRRRAISKMPRAAIAAAFSACLGPLLYACGSDDTAPVTTSDAGGDAADATTRGDATTDATTDAGTDGAQDAADATTGDADAGATDARADVDAGPCSPDRPFGAPAQISDPDAGIYSDYNMKLSLDELSAYFASDRTGDDDIYLATRAARGAAFGPGSVVAPLSAAGPQEYWASPDGAGLLLVLERDSRLYVSTRAHASDPWGTPVAPAALDIAADAGAGVYVGQPHLMADGATLYFASNLKGTWDIYRSTYSAGTWSTPTTVDELNTGFLEWAPVVTADGLTIYFGSDRPTAGDAGNGAHTIWVAHRASTASSFGAAHKVAELDRGRDEWPAWISPDNCRIYYTEHTTVAPGTNVYRTYVAEQ